MQIAPDTLRGLTRADGRRVRGRRLVPARLRRGRQTHRRLWRASDGLALEALNQRLPGRYQEELAAASRALPEILVPANASAQEGCDNGPRAPGAPSYEPGRGWLGSPPCLRQIARSRHAATQRTRVLRRSLDRACCR